MSVSFAPSDIGTKDSDVTHPLGTLTVAVVHSRKLLHNSPSGPSADSGSP